MVHKIQGFMLLLGVACSGMHGISAEPPVDPMPQAANGILIQMDKEINIAKTKALVALDKVLKDTTKKGDLAGAIAVKNSMERLKAEINGGGGRATPNQIAGRTITGLWMQGGTVGTEFLADGTVQQGGLTGRWTMDGDVVEIQWSNQRIYRLTMDADGLVGKQFEPTGKESSQVRLTRAK